MVRALLCMQCIGSRRCCLQASAPTIPWTRDPCELDTTGRLEASFRLPLATHHRKGTESWKSACWEQALHAIGPLRLYKLRPDPPPSGSPAERSNSRRGAETQGYKGFFSKTLSGMMAHRRRYRDHGSHLFLHRSPRLCVSARGLLRLKPRFRT